MDTNFDLVRRFVLDYFGPDFYTVIEPQTELDRDYKLDGDDAFEFLMAFSKKFQLEMSKFVFIKYFSEEGFLIDIGSLIRWIKGEKLYRKKEPLSLGKLADMIERGEMY